MQTLNEEWRKSTKSGHNGECVEVRMMSGAVELRDSKEPDGLTLRFTPAEWTAFLDGVTEREFELP